MKSILVILLATLSAIDANALLIDWSGSYRDLAKSADLIVIGIPTEVRDTEECKAVLGETQTGQIEPTPVWGVGVETTFRVLAVLKGDSTLKTFVLHHYRLEETKRISQHRFYVHELSFDPKQQRQYLLFLGREGDGRYTPASGIQKPDIAVQELHGTPPQHLQ